MNERRGQSARERGDSAVRRVARSALVRYLGAPRRRADAGASRRVTILLMSAWGMGGTIRAVFTLARALVARGYDVEIASVHRRREEPFFGDFPPGVRVTALDDETAPPRGLRRLLRAVLRRRPSVLMHPLDRAAQECSLWTDVRLAALLRRRPGFVIGTRAGFNLMLGGLRLPGLAKVGQEHMNLSRKGRRMVPAIERLYPGLDALVTLTDGDARAYDELLGGRLRLASIPNAVAGPPAAAGRDPADPADGRLVLAAGRLTRQKGFDLLIPAFGRVAAEHPGWRLRICGGGPLRNELQEQIQAEGLAGVVELTGPVEDMDEQWKAASLFVLSSRYEGFPLVLLEAMARGVPVVAADCPTGPAELIDDRRNGLLVAARDIAALAGGLGAMIADAELRRRCAAAATATVGAYSLERVGEGWDELLQSLWSERA
jgi:glycosyltransferase involved in cell wall biosynthesis